MPYSCRILAADPVTYREASPPPELREHVAAVWARRGIPNSPPLRVVPDGSADIIWHDDGRSVTAFTAGPDTEAQLAPLPEGSRMVGIRFAPGAADAVLGVPLDVLRDLRVPLAELWGPVADELAERGALSDRPEQTLATLVRDRIDAPPDATASAIARRLPVAAGPGGLPPVPPDVGVSERRLHCSCRPPFGSGPERL